MERTSSTIRALQGARIEASDGPIGEVLDVYFDDERWAVRYLVVDTGKWLPGRRVLISPASITAGGAQTDSVRVDLTRGQVKRAPGIDTEQPVSRLYEMQHAAHFGYPYYWSGPLLWGAAAYPENPLAAGAASMSPTADAAERAAREAMAQGDSHLRSAAHVIGYRIEAPDGALGVLRDFTVNARSWAILDMVVDAKPWWPGGEVRMPISAVEGIDAADRTVRLRFTRDQLKLAAA